MPINHNEIIEEMEGQIRKCHGAWEEWCVGIPKDSRGPFFQRHREADLGDGLAYREASAITAAEEVAEHLVTLAVSPSTATPPNPAKSFSSIAPKKVPRPKFEVRNRKSNG